MKTPTTNIASHSHPLVRPRRRVSPHAFANGLTSCILRHFSVGEPRYTRSEVSERDGRAGVMWVTFRDGVYDITDFHHEHPGGQIIRTAAGGSVDDFWRFWAIHHISSKVEASLERLRIGELADWAPDGDTETDGGLYEGEPWSCRGTGQDVFFSQPFCSQTRPEVMIASYLTPNHEFYVRNHAPVPELNAEDHEIEFCKSDGTELITASLSTLLEVFPPSTVTSIMQCSGNRAADNIAVNEGSGFEDTPFARIGVGMLGNAQWTGPKLSDILSALYPGVTAEGDDFAGLHVQFEGADGYGTSTPLSVIMAPENDCILATAMNGVPLPADHGFPVRALLPGIAGARNVKWLTKISVTKDESPKPWQSTFYKEGPIGGKRSIQHLPLNSVVLSIEPVGAVEDGMITVRGVAFSGEGHGIAKVEVSVDNGTSWETAVVDRTEVLKDDSSRSHGWVRWSLDTKISAVVIPESETTVSNDGDGAKSTAPTAKKVARVMVRAVDGKGGQQPRIGELNGGYVYNGYHSLAFESM